MSRCRSLLVWVVVTATAWATAAWALAGVGPSADLAGLLVAASGVALAGCAGWAWLVATVVIARALLAPGRALAGRHTWGVPGWAARAVLAACGVAALTGVPAQASDDVPHQADQASASTLDGLPFPDRAVGPAHAVRVPSAPPRASAVGTVLVRPGDSLWHIAARGLPPGASDAEVAAATAALHDLNRDVLGPDPDLIHPGLRLRTPGS